MQNLTVTFEPIEPGYTVKIETMHILENIRLEIYDGTDAVLYLGKNEVLFTWNDEVKAAFDNLDTCEPLELLMLLSNFTYKEPCEHVFTFNKRSTNDTYEFVCVKCDYNEPIRN